MSIGKSRFIVKSENFLRPRLFHLMDLHAWPAGAAAGPGPLDRMDRRRRRRIYCRGRPELHRRGTPGPAPAGVTPLRSDEIKKAGWTTTKKSGLS